MVTKPESRYTITLDDDPMVHQIIEKSTKIKSHYFTNPDSLLQEVENYQPIAAFVDIHLEGAKTGLEIVPTLRATWPFCPILVITASPAEEAIINALSSGADDFVRKPIIPEELMARLKLRMEDSAQKAAKEVTNFGDISIDSVHRTVSGPKGKRYASPIEITLLGTLAHTEGAIVEKDALKVRCWGQIKVTDNALHRKLHAVRSLLKDVSEKVTIHTKYGVGFALKAEGEIKIAS
ncbi:MAG: hypothetical protein CMP10_12215 [Zetaproteobacteria bacterium]|nr:hypothetical protein [Pseudobdellovibrionaceae bacterium]